MPKLLIFDAFTLLIPKKLSQITHFCGVKLLAWKSGCVKFLTNSMSAPVVPNTVPVAIIWVQKWARECAWLCTRPSLSRCWVPAPPPAPGDRVPLPPSGRADIPPPSCGRQGPLPAPHPTHVLPRPPRSYPPPHPHTLTPCAHLVRGWGGEA